MQNRPQNFEIVGHPSLQSFCEDFAKINPIGIKVAALGKEVIHVLASDDKYSNALLDAKASPRISSSEDLCKALLESCELKNSQDLYQMMVMPKDASDQVYNQIIYPGQCRRESA